jgi:hypothetical protein
MSRIKLAAAPIIAGLLICLAAFAGTSTAHAQCARISATNNLNCDIQLCLVGTNGAEICTGIPSGATVSIVSPTTFTPIGVKSAGGNTYTFSTATGCTVCFNQITPAAVRCCGTVCFDRSACTITVGACTSTICNP